MSKPAWMIEDDNKITAQRNRASKMGRSIDGKLMGRIFERHTELVGTFGTDNKRVVNRMMRDEFNLLDVDHAVMKAKAFRYKDC